MIFGSCKLFLATLIRYKTASILQLQVDAESELEAKLYAARIAGKNWCCEEAELIDAPAWVYSEYGDYKYWEVSEDETEHCRCFYYVLLPNSLKSFIVPGVSNRKNLFEYLDSLTLDRETYVRSDRF